MNGVWLILNHPHVADRSCDVCQAYQFIETGELRGQIERRGDRLVERTGLPPCRIEEVGCPKGTPESPRSLSDANQRAYGHYQECAAVGSFPCDELVQSHAADIAAVEKLSERKHQESFLMTMSIARR